jgi:hypothetical protein
MNLNDHSIPDARPSDIIAWAESRVRVNGGKTSFDASRTPQIIEPIRAMADPDVRIGTLVKPVQVGGSTAGEVVCAYWAAFASGLIQFNWEDDQKAADRWHDRIYPALESCGDIKRTGHRFEETICEARYPNATVRVQGVFNEHSLDSDTVPLQINEEIHSWKPGFLSKARRRQTQVWNAKAFDISNAGMVGDQLHSSYEDGTMEEWEILCPRCFKLHAMHFRWNPANPELGGLRWDSDGCKMENGRFNYNKLESTIRYQFPCGFEMRDVASERRTIHGHYSSPRNQGAHVSHRSWNFEAVSCDAIRWLSLIQEWHSSIRAMKGGDSEPLRRFVTERECKFFSDEQRPFLGRVVLNSGITKSRIGLADRAVRLWAADKQRGYRSAGELSHYWLVIRDVMENADSRLVFEGQIGTDSELIGILDEHKCHRFAGGVDASWDTKAVLELCYRNGLNAFMANASHKGWFFHQSEKVKRFYSEGKALHMELKMPPRFNYTATVAGWLPSREEPMVIQYNVAGMLANLFFIREHEGNVRADGGEGDFIRWEVPGDVSEDYQQQNDAWERTTVKQARTNDEVEGFRKTRKADHMTMCEAYIAMMMDIGGFLSNRLTQLGVKA